MADMDEDQKGRPIRATCPHCRGPLSVLAEGDRVEFTCLVGHRFSEVALFRAHSETQERTLWSAVVVLEEAAVLAREAAARHNPPTPLLLRQAADKQRQADLIRGLLGELVRIDLEE